jgi:hypothetical protein
MSNALINVEALVTKQTGEHWHLCQSWLRLSAVLVALDEAEAAAPLCVCGSPLQNPNFSRCFPIWIFCMAKTRRNLKIPYANNKSAGTT